MIHDTEHIKRSILVPLGVVLLALLAITIFSAQRWIELLFEKEMQTTISGAQQTYNAALANDSELMQGLLDFIKKDEALQQAWLSQDREKLLRTAQPIFEAIKHKYRVTHFYFHTPDKVNFLRVHLPSVHGDTINRFTLQEAVKNQKGSWGVELGPQGTFTLRIVEPWFIENRLAGYLELGEEISHIAVRLKKTLGVEVLSVINKQFVKRASWEQGMAMLGVPGNWDLLRHYVISDLTLSSLPPDLEQQLAGHHSKESFFLFHAACDGTNYTGGILPLKDVSGQEVGKFVVMGDVSRKQALLQKLALTQAISFIVLGTALYLLFCVYLDRLQKLLLNKRRLLETKIVEHQRSENALRESEERYRDLFENAHDLILIMEPDGRLLFANRSWRENMGYDSSEIGNLSFFGTISDDCLLPGKEAFARALRDGSTQNIKLTFMTSAKKRLRVEGSATCKYLEGKPVSVRCIFRDVSEQEDLREQLCQAQKNQAIGTLAAGIAHDFNNILTAILGYGSLLKKMVPQDSEGWENLQQVLRAGRRAKELVKQILTFSRQTNAELQPTHIHLVIKEALKLMRCTIPASITIKQHIPASCGLIMADPTQIHQVVMNLCTNAYHAMQEKGGELTVSLEPVELGQDFPSKGQALSPGSYLKLTVSDTGCGIDPKTLTRIFEPYFSTKERGHGTGLGLAVIQGIVAKHHGHITVRSELDKGTTFTVYFPLVKKAPPAVDADEGIPFPKGNEHILVVDDEEAIARFEHIVLEELGYTVQTFSESEEALTAFRRTPETFDLVISDMNMPRMTGIQLAEQLLAIRPEIPIILCSGFSEIIAEQQAKALGIEEYLMKPLTDRELANAVRKVLDRQKNEPH